MDVKSRRQREKKCLFFYFNSSFFWLKFHFPRHLSSKLSFSIQSRHKLQGSRGPRLSSTWWVSQMTSQLWSHSSVGRIGAARFLNSCLILKLTVTFPSSFCGVTLMNIPTLLAFRKAMMLQSRNNNNNKIIITTMITIINEIYSLVYLKSSATRRNNIF